MKIRITPSIAFLAVVTCMAGAGLLLSLPHLAYRQWAVRNYQAALARWQAHGSPRYTISVASNSYTQPTEGWNLLRVEDGQVIQASNPNCPDCPLEAFSSLTIEALFERIAAQCLDDFPVQYCNVAYDEALGYPIRLDTYPYHRAGEERPSITVESVTLLPAP